MSDNDWFEDGFYPPFNTKCEALLMSDSAKPQWKAGISMQKVFCPNGGIGLLFSSGTDMHVIHAISHFRPIKSEREKAIEDLTILAAEACGHESGLIPCRNIAVSLYDAGYRKVEV